MISKKKMLSLVVLLVSSGVYGVGEKPSTQKPPRKMYNISSQVLGTEPSAMDLAPTYISLQKELIGLIGNTYFEKQMCTYLIKLCNTFIEQYEAILNNLDNRQALLEELHEKMVTLREEYVNDEYQMLDIVNENNLQNLHMQTVALFREIMDYARIFLVQALTTPEQVQEAMRRTSESLEAFYYIRDEFQDFYNSIR